MAETMEPYHCATQAELEERGDDDVGTTLLSTVLLGPNGFDGLTPVSPAVRGTDHGDLA